MEQDFSKIRAEFTVCLRVTCDGVLELLLLTQALAHLRPYHESRLGLEGFSHGLEQLLIPPSMLLTVQMNLHKRFGLNRPSHELQHTSDNVRQTYRRSHFFGPLGSCY